MGGGGISGAAKFSNIVFTCSGVLMAYGDESGGIGGSAADVAICWDNGG